MTRHDPPPGGGRSADAARRSLVCICVYICFFSVRQTGCRTDFRRFLSSRTASLAAAPRRGGRKGRPTRESQREIGPGTPAGLVRMYISRARTSRNRPNPDLSKQWHINHSLAEWTYKQKVTTTLCMHTFFLLGAGSLSARIDREIESRNRPF
jgi:hypothetical protein